MCQCFEDSTLTNYFDVVFVVVVGRDLLFHIYADCGSGAFGAMRVHAPTLPNCFCLLL